MLMEMKVTSNWLKRSQKPLGSLWRFETSHSPLSDSSRAMGILGSIVQAAMLSALHGWYQILLRRTITPHIVGDDNSGSTTARLELWHSVFLG